MRRSMEIRRAEKKRRGGRKVRLELKSRLDQSDKETGKEVRETEGLRNDKARR